VPKTVRRQLAASALAAALLVALVSACGGDDDSDAAGAGDATTTTAAADAAAGATTTTAAGATTTAAEEPADEGVPDPCALIAGPDLAALVGSDPGVGTPSAYDPEQRKICSYASGMILAVEISENYETAIDIIRDETGEDSVSEVSGVGNAAVWQDVGGGVGQFIAQGDDYFVGVTLPAGGPEVGQAVAEAMLAAL
jgi:hypothetical protein